MARLYARILSILLALLIAVPSIAPAIDTQRIHSKYKTGVFDELEGDADSTTLTMGDGIWSNEELSYLRNVVYNLPGTYVNDLGMSFLYDRNILSNGAHDGTCTMTFHGAGSYTNTDSVKNLLTDNSGTGPLVTLVSASTDSAIIEYQYASNFANRGDENWQPFVHFMNGDSSYFPYADSIKVYVSADGATWYSHANWGTGNYDSTSYRGLWMGDLEYPGIGSFNYVKFCLYEFTTGTSNYFYISELGLRHRSEKAVKTFATYAALDTITHPVDPDTLWSIDPDTVWAILPDTVQQRMVWKHTEDGIDQVTNGAVVDTVRHHNDICIRLHKRQHDHDVQG